MFGSVLTVIRVPIIILLIFKHEKSQSLEQARKEKREALRLREIAEAQKKRDLRLQKAALKNESSVSCIEIE